VRLKPPAEQTPRRGAERAAAWRAHARRITSHQVVRGGVLIAAATLLWHLSNFAFNSVAARLLGPADYGNLAAVIALLYGASPILNSVQTVASRVTTKLEEDGEWSRIRSLMRFYGIRLAFASLLFAALIALFSGPVSRFLRVSSPVPIAMMGVALMIAVPVNLQRGVLQGTMRFRRFAMSLVTEATVKLAVAIVLLVWLWRSVNGAVLAVVVSALGALVANWALMRFLPVSRGRVDPIPHPYRYSLLTLVSLTLLAVLLAADVLAAKRYLDAETAGLYAAVSLSGKIVFFSTSALSLVLFPWFSSRSERGLDSRAGLGGGLALIGISSVVLVTIYFLAPELVVRPLFGSDYLSIDGHLGWIGIAYAFYAVVYLSTTYLLSQANSFGVAALAVALVLELAGLFAFHASISQIVAVLVAVFGAAALVLGVYSGRRALFGTHGRDDVRGSGPAAPV
jgi:O-antigen/teichoic acid export membrane protein